ALRGEGCAGERWGERPVLPRSSDVFGRGDLGGEKEAGTAGFGDAAKDKAGRVREGAGDQAARRIDRPEGVGRHLPLRDARDLRAAGASERWVGLAHAARGRDRVRRLRYRYYRRV